MTLGHLCGLEVHSSPKILGGTTVGVWGRQAPPQVLETPLGSR